MRLFGIQLGGPPGVSATLADPGDFRSSDATLPISVLLENSTDGDVTATLLKVKVRRKDKAGSSTESTKEVSVRVPARSSAVLESSHTVTLGAVGDELPPDVPEWMRSAIGMAARAAAAADSGSGEFEVSVAVYFDGLDAPARDHRRVYRHGPGSFGVRL